MRIFAYRRVQGYPLYVVAGRSRASIIAGWRGTMARPPASSACPSTLALVAVTWTALVRSRSGRLQALGRAHQEIERRERAEAALLKSQRLEAVGQMTGGVAHDFNNLLTVILGSAELLGRRADDPGRVRSMAQQIILAAQHGGQVTQQLLTFSRRQLMHPETVDLNDLLRAFRPLLERRRRRGRAHRARPGARPAPVRLDPGHFEAAILNLVGNARDAMPAAAASGSRRATSAWRRPTSRTCRPATTCACRSPTTGAAWTRKPPPRRSSRSSPPRRSARAPGWA